MPSAGPYAGPELVEPLATNEIEFFGEHAIERIDADRKTIHFDNGTAATIDLLVFVPPHEPAITLDGPGTISVDVTTVQTRHVGIFAIGDTTAIGATPAQSSDLRQNGAKAAAMNTLHHLALIDTSTGLSGQGYCYVDTDNGHSALGQGDFFTMPHPAIQLSPPSQNLHHDKQDEERDWRTTWERQPSETG